MGFEDRYRLSAHAVITDTHGRVLQVQATYGNRSWGLPGGAVDPGETLHETLIRECREELGCSVNVLYLSGIYLHSAIDAHVAIFRCELPDDALVTLSPEHADYRFFSLEELTPVQRRRVEDCLGFDGCARSHRF